ncbi:hypothetical protein ACOME3_001540 [Neoechinorhynchus agilis]
MDRINHEDGKSTEYLEIVEKILTDAFNSAIPPPRTLLNSCTRNVDTRESNYQRNQLPIVVHRSSSRRKRTNFDAMQRIYLMSIYKSNPKPSRLQRQEIANATGLSYATISTWFQNHRSIERKREQCLNYVDISRASFHEH